jgi:hypothetical protein
MGRRGVAATFVSVLVFTSLLLANSALYSSSNSALAASITTSAQLRERAYAGVLAGFSAYSALESVQGYLESHPLYCDSPDPYLRSLGGSAVQAGSEDGVRYRLTTSWAYAPDGSAAGGSPLLPGYSGYAPGALGLIVSTSTLETFQGGLPSYAGTTSEDLHLPVPLNATLSLCSAALQDLNEALSSLPYCNSTGVDRALLTASSAYPALATFTTSATAVPQAGMCEVNYWVTASEAVQQGPSGPFQWVAEGGGSLSSSASP